MWIAPGRISVALSYANKKCERYSRILTPVKSHEELPVSLKLDTNCVCAFRRGNASSDASRNFRFSGCPLRIIWKCNPNGRTFSMLVHRENQQTRSACIYGLSDFRL